MWKQIEDYPNYEVSSEGQVRNIKTNQILKNQLSPMRYVVNLYTNDAYKKCYLHRLVATAFIPNNEGKPEVDHIDRNKLNNNVSNLRWVSRNENACNIGYRHRKDNKELHHIVITPNGSYKVQINHFYKSVCCKIFKTKEEAIIYRDEFMASNPR